MFIRMLPAIFSAALAVAQVHPGSTPKDFQLQDLDGRPVQISLKSDKLTAVVFIATQCPVSNAYNERMEAVYKEFSDRGVRFLFINSNVTEPASEVRDHAKRVGFTFPVFKDKNNVVADQFGAESTPETYVIDGKGVVRYHGSIDDSQNPARIKVRGLKSALDDLLAGKAVGTSETRAFGCTIKRVRSGS